MRWLRAHTRLLVLLAWLALGAQGAVALESVWHHHDDAPAGRHDNCAVCACASEHGQPIDPIELTPIPQFVGIAPVDWRELPAHLYVLAALTSRGPPATPVV